MLINTARIPWVSLREAVTEDDAAITDFKYDNMPAVGATPETGQNGSVDLRQPPLQDASGLMIAAWGKGGDNKVITGYKLLGVARTNGPIVTLLSGVMTSGSLACSVHPLTKAVLTSNFWVDTISVTGGLLRDLTIALDSGKDRICMLQFDQTIFERVFLEYDEASSGMTEFNAIITGY